jgi:hypothetical protein
MWDGPKAVRLGTTGARKGIGWVAMTGRGEVPRNSLMTLSNV